MAAISQVQSTDYYQPMQHWKKVLYERRDVPDNYVDASFLTEMKKNLYLRTYDYRTLVFDSGRITQQTNSVLIFVMCYVYLMDSLVGSDTLICVSTSLTLLCYFITCNNKEHVNMWAVLVFASASFILSPVLMSLTETTSTDTIYAMTSLMFILHIFSYEYQDNTSEIYGAVSLNAAIFATVCLASRFKSIPAAYSLLLLSIFFFTVLPNTRRCIRQMFSYYIDIAMTVLLYITSGMMIFSQSLALAIIHLFFCLFVTFACPFLLLKLQPLKNNIYGPWDEAVI